VVEVLFNWQIVYKHAFSILEGENATWGGDKLASAKDGVDQLLNQIVNNLSEIQTESLAGGDINGNT